jgi:Tol biopolymer transport system component/DNA-binding winged helix-turn-helix (wHTH) protein
MVESRTPEAQASRVVRFGAFELDLRTGELRKSGLRVGLQDQPLQVLTMLLERRGELVTREELRQRLWPADTFVDFEQGLNAAVKRLRYVLGDSAEVPRFIETLPRRGYRWTYAAEPVRRIPDVDQTPVVSAARRRVLSPRTRWLALAAVVLAAGVLAFMSLDALPPASESVSRLRVVPLTSLSGVESDPALSPDGKSLAFCWDGDGEPGIYVKRIDDDQQVRVGHGPAGVFSPTWSPDGREIAFLRHPETGERVDEIVVVPASGGSERRLGTSIGSHHGMDWSPDGRLLAFVGKASAEAPDAIHLLAIETGERRRLTTPVDTSAADAGDSRPAFSPDGQSVAFIRRGDVVPASTGVYVQEIGSSVSRPVTSGQEVRDVAWLADGRSLVFVAGRPSEPNLWIVDAPMGKPRRLSADSNVVTISTARGSQRLAFEQRFIDINVWRGSGPASLRKQPPQALLRSPRTDTHPDYSPDGRHIAFASARMGRLGIWTCAEDGNDCVAFKADGSMAVPRWSFDGQSIAAVGWQDDVPNDLYRLEVAGRFVRRLTTDNALDTMPSWSRDGRWLYFASNRTGTIELWKMPSTGGDPRQLTRRGGAVAHETADGRWIYFNNRMPFGSLWRMPAEGGDETLVLDKQIHHNKWALWQDHIIYMDEQSGAAHHVMMFDPKTRRITRLASLEKGRSGPGLAVSPDGAWILYTQEDQVIGDILMLEGLK